ncbi:MAG: lysylphosphatidylglycerol synthase transmembrane domain-containing protein [Planctomycetota bacterium]
MSEKRKSRRRWLWWSLKIAVATLVIAWMVHQNLIRADKLAEAAGRWPLLVLAFAGLMLGVFLQSVRWGVLIGPQGTHARLGELYILTMTGLFFSAVAPGGVGGDPIKMYYIARGRENKAEAATTVFVDRFLGLITLFVIGCVMILLDLPRLWSTDVGRAGFWGLRGGQALVLATLGGTAAMLLASLAVTSKRVRRARLVQRLGKWVPFRATIRKVYLALHLYGEHPGVFVRAAAISVVAQAPIFVAYYLYGRAIGAEIELQHCALIVPLAMVIRVLPLFPGGAGQGVAAMALLFPLVGVENGGDIGALGDAVFVLLYLVGGLFFLFGRTSYCDLRTAARQT